MAKRIKAFELCKELLFAESESEVDLILTRHGLLHNPIYWRDFGDTPANYSIIGNQQSEPDLALAEKITNAIDAVLIAEVKAKGIDPESDKAPSDLFKAAKKYVFMNGAHESRIALSVTGSKKLPSITIIDSGEGQTSHMMPNTLLSLQASNKNKIPFVQGKFNMGGTGALRFSGKSGTQFIVTKRHPQLVERDDENVWSFTVVRRFPPKGNERKSVYRYLAPLIDRSDLNNKNILTFKCDEMPLFPSEAGAYQVPTRWGTAIKLYDYDARGFRGNAISSEGVFGRLNLALSRVAIPFEIYEHRNYENQLKHITLRGIVDFIRENKKDLLEKEFPVKIATTIEDTPITLEMYLFKKDAEMPIKAEDGIIFTVNGQVHGKIHASFFSSGSVGLSYLEKSLFAVVDCTRLPTEALEKFFMNNREKVSFVSELGSKIKEKIVQELSENSSLQEFNLARREELIIKASDHSKISQELFNNVLHQSPWIASLFKGGVFLDKLIKEALGPQKNQKNEIVFEGNFFPTFFEPEFKGFFCLAGEEARMRFKTDAVNDYFHRPNDPGSINIEITTQDRKVKPIKDFTGPDLRDGIGLLKFMVPADLQTGVKARKHEIWITVNDISREEPLLCNVGLYCGNPENKESKDIARSINTRSAFKAKIMPNISWVTKDLWHEMEMDGNSSVRVKLNPYVSSDKTHMHFDFYINRDNASLQTFLERNAGNDNLNLEIYKMALVTLALSSIIGAEKKVREELEDLKDNADVARLNLWDFKSAMTPAQLSIRDTVIEKSCRYVARQTDNAAPVILPIISSLASLSMEAFNRPDNNLLARQKLESLSKD